MTCTVQEKKDNDESKKKKRRNKHKTSSILNHTIMNQYRRIHYKKACLNCAFYDINIKKFLISSIPD
jgi:hypothetical protein